MGETSIDRTPFDWNRSIELDPSDESVSTDAGALLMRETLEHSGIVSWLEENLIDDRRPGSVLHSTANLLRTCLLLLCQGHRDKDDADRLRHDPAIAAAKSSGGPVPFDGGNGPTALSRFVDQSRVRNNPVLNRMAEPHPEKPADLAPCEVRTVFHEYEYQARGWDRKRRVTPVVIFSERELFPRHFWLITNLARELVRGEKLLARDRARGKAENTFGELKSTLRAQLPSSPRPKRHGAGKTIERSEPPVRQEWRPQNEAFRLLALPRKGRRTSPSLLRSGPLRPRETGEFLRYQ